MKILCLIDRLCTPGGAERQLLTLAKALAARGHQCSIAALFPGSDLANDLPALGIEFHELRVPFFRDFIGAGTRVARLIRRNHFDVVQAHLLSSSIASGLSRALAGGPARVVVLHNPDYEVDPPRNFRQKALRFLHGFCLRRLTDGNVAVSESVAQHYRNEMGLRNITAIPNSIELGRPAEAFLAGREKIRKELEVDDGTRLLAYSGRMVGQKAHFLLLRALELLRDRGMHPRLMLIGDGPLEADIRRAARAAGLDGQVIMTGNMPYEEALRHVAAADVFVSASRQEGFGLAIAEAMALGVPAVATAVGGVTDIIENGVSGLLAPTDDAEALADAIARVLADGDLRQRLKRAGPERIRKCFSPAAVAERWETYLETLTASRACPKQKQERAAPKGFEANA